MSSYEYDLRNPTFENRKTGKTMPNDTGWQTRHAHALAAPRGFEIAIVNMLAGWAAYADKHRRQYDSPLGADYVLGSAWATLGRSIHDLLDGETGRLDCGTLSAFIHDVLQSEGFTSE